MYQVKFGGKNGKTVRLEESPDLVAIRTKGNKDLDDVQLSRQTRELVNDTVEVAKFPEAGITVRKVAADEPATDGLESFNPTRGELGPPPSADTTKRDETRAALKQEENIRFAGRVLQDSDTGEVTLYTENFFVKFYDKTSEADCLALLSKYQLKVKNKLPFAANSYFVEASEGTGLKVFGIAEQLLKEKQVEFCHPELVQERRFKNIHPLQWHLAKTTINGHSIDAHINIEAAWKITRGKDVTVAVIDDGVDIDHPEFAGRVVHSFDATLNNSDPRPKDDGDNHGTACAGMACAAGLQDGASGTAPEAFLMPIRLRSGLGSMAEATAFAWAADHGADVISCSWGPADGKWWDPGDAIHNRRAVLPDSTRLAMEYALTKGRKGKGCVILFAAGNGNESTDNDGYVSYPGVMSVAACNDTGTRSVYSDYGSGVWVSFPSGDFAWKPLKHNAPFSEGLRTVDRRDKAGYTTLNYTNSFGGTSGACPGMAGVVALILSANPNLTAPEVKDLVRRSCTRIDETAGEYNADGHSPLYGFGRIDAGKAVENARLATQPATSTAGLTGRVRFSKTGEMAFQNGVLLQQPEARLLGLSLGLQPAVAGLQVRYRINVPSLGMLDNQKEGQFVGAASGRQRIIGLAIWLEGTGAANYDLEYNVRLAGQKDLVSGKNGSWIGALKKSGKTVEAIAVTLKKH